VSSETTPVFIGDDGNRCAIAALLERAGHRALVERIARTRNLAYVTELSGEPELQAWLVEHGLTFAEAARIQPAYHHRPAPPLDPTGTVFSRVLAGSSTASGAQLAFGVGLRVGVGIGEAGAVVAEFVREIVAGGPQGVAAGVTVLRTDADSAEQPNRDHRARRPLHGPPLGLSTCRA